MKGLQLLVINGGDRDMTIIIMISYQSYCVYIKSTLVSHMIKLPFVIPYNLNTSQIGKTMHSHWHLIQEDDELQDLFAIKPVVAFKRNKNIKDILVHSNMAD